MKKLSTLLVAVGIITSFNANAAQIDDELSGVDLTKITTFVGEGENVAPVVIRFNYPYAVDNIVLGYKYNGTTLNPVTVLQEIATADSRINFAVVGQMRYTLGLDLNGDGTIDESDNLYTTGAEGRWVFTQGTIAGVTGVLISFDRSGDNIKSPVFYLPAADTKGVWIPESLTAPLADENLTIVAYVQTLSDGIQTQAWRRSSTTDSYQNDATILSSATPKSDRLYSMTGQFKGNQGVTYIQFRPKFTGAGYIESNWCTLTVTEPVIPVTSLSWANDNMNCRLSHAVENALVYEPANATFTMVTLSSSNTKVATASGAKPNAAKVTTTTTPGTATITATYAAAPEMTTSFDLTSSLVNAVESVTFDGVGADGAIHLNPKQMTGLFPIFTPADPDITTISVELIGAGTDRESVIASMYKVNYWDENNVRIQPYELSGHHVGECTLKVTSGDGNFIHEYPVIVEEPDRTPLENGYVDGTLMLNEEWFGHTNGGLNYITPEYELMYQVYERENPGMSFGATSQYATIWANKLIVCSKQAVDGGDPLPGGGRIVVADAKTLKRIGSIDNIAWGEETGSADGRACVGASPTKVYVGSTKGVYVVDLKNIEIVGKIGSIENDGVDLYNGQMGDMVNAAGFVYAIKQAAGVYVIDTKKDKVVEFIPASGVQGITRTADGHVWYVTTVDDCSNFVELDPATSEEISRFVLTADYGTVACSWGAWRNTQFVGCKSQNAIWFATGAQGIAGGGDGVYYRFDTETNEVKLVADIRGLEGSNSRVKQKNYGTLRYDDRSGELIVMTCDDGSSGHYRYNWYHFFDPETATLKRTITPRPYYWFQCFAIFPDKYAPQLTGINILNASSTTDTAIKLTDIVTDDDHPATWFYPQIDVVEAMAFDGSEDVAEFTVKNGKLNITPKAAGIMNVKMSVESNGQVTNNKALSVLVGDLNLIDAKPYTLANDVEDVDVKYTRNFKHQEWQAWYVPFAVKYDEIKDLADVAEFVGVTSLDGTDCLEFRTVTSGTLQPHTPYIISPKSTGSIVFESAATTLSGAPETDGSVSYKVGGNTYTLTGIYQGQAIDGCYALKNGVFMKGETSGQTLSPNRIYLSITTSGANAKPQKVGVRVDGQSTGITSITTDEVEIDGYNIRGQRVTDDYKGIVIKKGQKTINK